MNKHKPAGKGSEDSSLGKMRKVLIVDDDEKITALLEDILKENHFLVASAQTTEDAWEKVTHIVPDLILLDVEIPLKGGLVFCREIKEKDPYRMIPIIFLTVRDQEMDIASALSLGGDDFITKPFRQKELMARINVALRRSFLRPQKDVIRSGSLQVDFNGRVVKVNQKVVHLTPKEFELLRLLYTQRERVLSDKDIFNRIWGSECDTMPSTVYTHINRLRNKLKEHGAKIKTVPGAGFRFDQRDES